MGALHMHNTMEMSSTDAANPPPTPPTLVLTRYLYDKNQVIQRLRQTVLQQDIQETFFWVYELYFSGFIQEVIHEAFVIYDEHYKARYPKLKAFLQKKTREIRECAVAVDARPIDHTLIGTMYFNMATRTPILNTDEPPTEWKGRSIYANVSPEKINPFMTQTAEQHKIPARKFLKEVCKYSCRTTDQTPNPDTVRWFRERWEYCASQSPYWNAILSNYRHRFDEDWRIVFEDEHQEEAFYEKYGYEPDEQPANVQQGCLG
jgi:hypothetical protein